MFILKIAVCQQICYLLHCSSESFQHGLELFHVCLQDRFSGNLRLTLHLAFVIFETFSA